MNNPQHNIKLTSYDILLKTFKAELKVNEEYKKTMVLRLAEQLEKEKVVALDKINQKLSEDLAGYVTKQWIGKVLDGKYKDAIKLANANAKHEADETKLMVQLGEQGLETTYGDVKDEVTRIKRGNEADESDKFREELRQALDAKGIDPTQMNVNVYKELSAKIEELDTLNNDHYNLRKAYADLDHILTDLHQYCGKWIKYDTNFNVLEVKED
jgi:hypothetical protein